MTHRTAVEIVEEIQDLDNRRLELESELIEETGMPYDQFVLGMKALVLPDPQGGAALLEYRRQYGGGL
jgi:hypothetical protein